MKSFNSGTDFYDELRRALAVLKRSESEVPAEVAELIGREVFGDYATPAEAMDVCLVLGSFKCGYRVRAAFAVGGADARYVVTGGNAVASGETEAAFMRGMLVGLGVAEERIACDPLATCTIENLRHATPLVAALRETGKVLKVAVVTGGFHLVRTMACAREAFAGVAGVELYPAPAYGPNTGRDSWHLNATGRRVVGHELEGLLQLGRAD